MTESGRVDEVWAALDRVSDPEIRRPLTELGMIDEVHVDGDAARIRVALTVVGCPASRTIEANVREAALGVSGIKTVEVDLTVMTPERRAKLVESLRGRKAARQMPFTADSTTRVIAVTSGKGGVGKSTVTVNLAVELAQRGLRVGIIDADVHGFSVPGLLGLTEPDADGRPHAVSPTPVGDLIMPPTAHGVSAISIGMFIRDDSAAVSWRGPMLHRTLQQFLTDVFFGDIDFLVLDLPPGTGDIAISMGQMLPHAEVVVVTTPQPAAADVAERSAVLARQTGQTVIGVIETMGPVENPDGSVTALFGSGGGEELAKRLSSESEVPLLASIPLDQRVREAGDAGEPFVLSPGAATTAVAQAADRILARGRGLAHRPLGVSVR